MSEGWIVVNILKIIGGWELGLWRNRIVVKVTEGIMSEGWIVVNIRKIIGG